MPTRNRLLPSVKLPAKSGRQGSGHRAAAAAQPARSQSPTIDLPRSQTSPKHLRLGALLRDARVAAGLTQAALAAMLGRKQAFVSKYEKGVRGLDAVDFLAILDLLGADVEAAIQAVRQAGPG